MSVSYTHLKKYPTRAIAKVCNVTGIGPIGKETNEQIAIIAAHRDMKTNFLTKAVLLFII